MNKKVTTSAADDITSTAARKLPPDERAKYLYRISHNLLWPLAALFLIIVAVLIWAQHTEIQHAEMEKAGAMGFSGLTALVTFFIGVVGGYVSLQRRLQAIGDEELVLISNSPIYTMLAPFVGGLLALLALFIFVGGLLSGPLFPEFTEDSVQAIDHGFTSVLAVHATSAGYARLIVWAFIAGYSERFVLDVIGQFERKATHADPEKPE